MVVLLIKIGTNQIDKRRRKKKMKMKNPQSSDS